MPDGDGVQCTLGAELRAKVENMHQWLEGLDEKVAHIQNRPPVWCTLMMTGMGGLIGWLLNALF